MMKTIPKKVLVQFDSQLNAKRIPSKLHGFYRKWLRFYLDFCHKYDNDSKNPETLPLFINKLREKNQSRQK